MISTPLTMPFLIGAMTCLSYAQSNTPHVLLGAVDQHSYDGVARLMRDLPGKLDVERLRAIVPGSSEERVMESGRKSIERLLNLRFDTFPAPRAFTLVADDGDSLAARWDLTNTGRIEQFVWLLDTPFTTTAVIEVPSAILAQDSIPQYVESLMRWDHDSAIDLKNITIRYLLQEGDQQIAVGPAKHEETSKGTFYLWFAAMSTGLRGYVWISVPKRVVFQQYALEDCEVRERFPPLSERIKTLGRTDLLQDLGKGQFRQQSHIYPDNRDEILLNEITEREPLTGDEMRAYLFADPGRFRPVEELPTYRLRVLLRVLARRGQLLQSKDSLASIALTATLPPQYLGLFYISLCSCMVKEKIEFAETSIAMLKLGKAASSSINCLARAAKDESDLQRLSKIAVPREFEERRKLALDSARFRIENERGERERLERLRNPPPQPKRAAPRRPLTPPALRN